MFDYSEYDGVGLSSLIKNKDISIPALLESVIDQIERLNPELNAVVYKAYDQARHTAFRLEQQMLSSGDNFIPGPLFGVPFLIKNFLTDCKDTLFSDGSGFVEGHISKIDSELVKRYKRAGLIICGRTNASELGVQPTTEPSHFGPTRNPLNIHFTAGGSSGGSAAAVASAMVPAAHGSDGGGSLRIPGSCCGLFALKPNRARNPLGPLFGDLGSGMVCEHALTRTVRDSAALLDISQGPAEGDPYFAPPFTGSYFKQVGMPPGKLKIALLNEIPEGWSSCREIHQDCKKAAEDAAAFCETLGHYVETVKPSELAWPGLEDMFLRRFCGFVNHAVKYWERELGKKARESDFESATWELYQAGGRISAGDYLRVIEDQQLFSRKITQWYRNNEWQLLLTPTMAIPPTEIGAFLPSNGNPEQWLKNAVAFVTFTRIQNITGQPAVSVPLYLNEEGLPIGVQFAARTGAEDLLIRFSSQLEQAHPWT